MMMQRRMFQNMRIALLKIQSDSDYEEEDEIEHQLGPKWRRATGPAHQQPAPGPTWSELPVMPLTHMLETPEKNHILDMTQGFSGHNINCNIFFLPHTSWERESWRGSWPWWEHYEKKVWAPAPLLTTNNRPVKPSKFVYTANTVLGSLYRDGRTCGHKHQKPEIILDYNSTKEGVDDMDKLLTAYSCKRRTPHLPPVIFFNILDISAYSAFVIWMALNPEWNRGRLHRKRFFLEELGKELVRPQIQRR